MVVSGMKTKQQPQRLTGQMDGVGEPQFVASQNGAGYVVQMVGSKSQPLSLEQVRRIAAILHVDLEEVQS